MRDVAMHRKLSSELRRRAIIGGAIILALGAAPADGGTLTVSPIRVQLPAGGQTEVVRIKNRAPETVLIQVEARHWDANSHAASRAQEILAVPPVFEVPGNREQVVRLALRAPLNGPAEAAYRLLVTEVPRTVNSGGLTFAVRFNLPVFVTPPGASAEPVWSLERAPGGDAALVLENSGTAHVRIEDLKLTAEARIEPVLASKKIEYALAGERVTWALGQSYGALPPVLEVRAETNHGPIVVQVRPGGGG